MTDQLTVMFKAEQNGKKEWKEGQTEGFRWNRGHRYLGHKTEKIQTEGRVEEEGTHQDRKRPDQEFRYRDPRAHNAQDHQKSPKKDTQKRGKEDPN